jgi:hypothetical protein
MINFDQNKYKRLLGEMESNNNYKSVNPIGALGKYQFLKPTLNGLKNIYSLPDWKSASYFLNNPEIQELYETTLIADSLGFIERNNLKLYIGKQVAGTIRFKNIKTPLNLYGMLAAIHLAGTNALKDFLINGTNPDDGNTSLSDYAAYFSSKLQDSLNLFPLVLALIPAIVLYYK